MSLNSRHVWSMLEGLLPGMLDQVDCNSACSLLALCSWPCETAPQRIGPQSRHDTAWQSSYQSRGPEAFKPSALASSVCWAICTQHVTTWHQHGINRHQRHLTQTYSQWQSGLNAGNFFNIILLCFNALCILCKMHNTSAMQCASPHFGPARFRFFSRRSWQQHIHGYLQHDWRGLLWDSFSIFSFITPSSGSWQAASSDQAGHAPLRTRCTCLRHGIQNLPHTAKDLARTAQPLGPGSAKVEQLNAALSMREWTAHFTWKHWAFCIRHGCWHAGTVTKAQWTCSKKDSLICSVPLLVSMPWRTIIARTGEKATRIHRSKDSSMFNTWMRLIQVSYLINLKVTQGKSANASLVHHAMPDVPPMLEVKCLWYAWGLLMTTKWIRTSDDFAWQYMFDLRLWTEQCSCTQSISLPRLGGYFEIPELHCEYVD